MLQRLGVDRQQGLGSLSTLCSLPESKDKGIVLIFDDVTALTGRAGALDTFLQEIRSLQICIRYCTLLAWLLQTVKLLMRSVRRMGRADAHQKCCVVLAVPFGNLRIAMPASAALVVLIVLRSSPFSCRVQGIVLVGVPTLPLDVLAATSDVRWSSFPVVRDPNSGDMRGVFLSACILVS